MNLNLNILFFDGLEKFKNQINSDVLLNLMNKTGKLLDSKKEVIVNLKNKIGEVSLVFVDDIEIKRLNKEWRLKNEVTDVLSFCDYKSDDFPEIEGQIFLGEIFISLETAEVQMHKFNHSLQKEVEKLFIHGLLHLLGFLHNTEKNYKIMKEWEDKILL